MKNGYVVFEVTEKYEQALALDNRPSMPDGGVLTWPDTRKHRTVFPSRQRARDAITRTHHYHKAFNVSDGPEKLNCKIQRVVSA